ncbi:Ig-like domain repeat protein [Methanobrevibacter sp.]|uniref:Ig-like domain repeat protein n=1 Tax=Methanobrevibacter sp. TaxID=66852 RepID=UPI00388EE021
MITISAASAAEDVASDLSSMEDNEEIILEEGLSDESILNDADKDIVLDENNVNEDPISKGNNEEEKLSETTGTFTDLENDINGNDDTEISLNKNYVFNPDSDSSLVDGIIIKRELSIDGNGITIDGNHLARIFQVSSGNVKIHNINFINGEIDEYSGGAILWQGKDGSLSNCSFINNTALVGGALMMMGTNTAVSNCNFINNYAISQNTRAGGAIYWYSDNATINNCTFKDNRGKLGGAIHMYYSSGTISDSVFINNSAEQSGGAIYTEEIDGAIYGIASHNYLNITNSTFESNHAKMDGGAINLYGSANCTISNCNFAHNTADDGGAVDADGLMNNTVSNCKFTENIAGYNGGAIFWISANGSVSNCNFTDNEAENGGAIYWYLNDGSITGSNFINNTANYGGAIDGKGNVANSNFVENKASHGGAMDGGTATNCTFIKNNADSAGGAINEGNAINSNFTENNAESTGGAINEGNAINCNFINNTANYGGAMNDGNAISSNFTDNKAYENGEEPAPGESKSDAMLEGIAVNCIFINNEYRETKVYSSASLVTSDYTSTYDSGETLEIKLVTPDNHPLDGIQAKITVYQGSEKVGTYYAPTGEGWEVNLSPGDYIASIYIEELPEVVGVAAELKITKASTEISTYDASFEFNASRQFVSVILRDGNGKTIKFAPVTIQIDEKNSTTMTDQNGEIRVSARNLGIGPHTLTVRFDENENYTGSTNSSIMTVIPSRTMIECEDYVGEYGSADEIVITLYDSEAKLIKGAKLTVDIDGPKTYTTDNKGQIKVPVNELQSGSYKALILFEGNENYSLSYQKLSVDIAKVTSQIIYENMTTTAVDVDTDGRIGKNFTITLKDSKGNALANKAVQIGFNGKVYDRVTDKDGKANLQINLKNAGTYTFAICFLGDENYNGSFAVAKIVVNKQKGSLTVPNKSFKASATSKTLTATFKSASGKVVANKKITFTVNGKSYSATTNDKGVATVKVSLNKKGTYSFTAKFAGNNMYAAITKTAKLTIK